MTATRLVSTLCLVLLLCLGTSGSALAAFGVEFLAPDQGAVQEIGFFYSFHNTITNTGDEADVFVVSMVKNMPGTWVGTICVGETCYPPFITEVEVPLGAGETAFLDIDITPMDTAYGSCEVTVSSLGDPSQRPMRTFTVLSTGLDLLLVTDDTTPTLESYYTSALAGTGKTMGVWKQVEMGSLSNLELAEFGTVVWSAGNLEGALDDDDRTALAYFVQHGGNLFLSGRDLAYEACDPGSPYYTANTLSWFNTILGTGYTGEVASTYDQAQGVAGDAITSDLSFGLSGGDGANNTHLTLDGVTPVESGLPSLRYFDTAVGEEAAIRSSYGEGMTYFCAFAFEAIADAASRTTLMERVILWFDGQLSPVEGEQVAPLLTRAPFASPNPFNPQTSIKFSVGGVSDVPAEIAVYDLRGQLVRRLFKGTVTPGAQDFVWNGRDDQGQNLATGVYLAQIKLAGAQAQTVKMTLAK
jgi:hypothetical protein